MSGELRDPLRLKETWPCVWPRYEWRASWDPDGSGEEGSSADVDAALPRAQVKGSACQVFG
jgi:hypothetical protein